MVAALGAMAIGPVLADGTVTRTLRRADLYAALRDYGNPAIALAAYERLRRPRAERVAAWGAKMGGTKTTGPLLRVLRDLALPRILAKGATAEAMDKQAWMFRHHIQWDQTPSPPPRRADQPSPNQAMRRPGPSPTPWPMSRREAMHRDAGCSADIQLHLSVRPHRPACRSPPTYITRLRAFSPDLRHHSASHWLPA